MEEVAQVVYEALEELSLNLRISREWLAKCPLQQLQSEMTYRQMQEISLSVARISEECAKLAGALASRSGALASPSSSDAPMEKP